MYQYEGLDDTVAAISTPSGQGGIGIVRLSGKTAIVIVDGMFQSHTKKKLIDCKSFTTHYGWIKTQENQIVDEVLITIMRSPKSYTKEDIVEINCHGGIVSLKAILEMAHERGARLAQPGEFTKRAFLNGRIDLAQAEAVLDIIQSKTDAFLKVSSNQLKGELSTKLKDIREQLMATYVEIEAIVNFPEDEIDAKGRERLQGDIQKAIDQVEDLLGSADQGRLLKEGIKVVLCGKPNVGKSSLLNVLLKTDRAIVSDIAGTTRDTIEETAQMNGFPFQLVDTAGILEPRDLIEEEAVKRSHMYMQGADMVLLLLDASRPMDQDDHDLIKKMKDQNLLIVLNKTDLPQQINIEDIDALVDNPLVHGISALKQTAIDQLKNIIVEQVLHGQDMTSHGLLISNLRHINALKDCQKTLAKAQKSIGDLLSLEFVSEEIKIGVNYLDSITGKNIDHDLLNTIFSQFCIGK